MMRRSVDLPQPEGPRIATNSPGAMFRSTPSSAVTGPGKTRWTPRRSTEMPDSDAVVGSSCIVERFKGLRVRILLLTYLQARHRTVVSFRSPIRFPKVSIVDVGIVYKSTDGFPDLQVLRKKYLNARSPVKLSLVQSGGLVYTLYGSTTNDS